MDLLKVTRLETPTILGGAGGNWLENTVKKIHHAGLCALSGTKQPGRYCSSSPYIMRGERRVSLNKVISLGDELSVSKVY